MKRSLYSKTLKTSSQWAGKPGSLLVSGVVEARGCERFYIVGEHHPDPDMKAFYQRLAREEAGHYTIFTKIAKQYFDPEVVDARLEDWLNMESEIMLSLEFRAAVH